VVRYLKTHTNYQAILSSHDESSIHRSDFEKMVQDYLSIIYQKLFKFTTGDNRRFFEYIFMRYEIEILKRILRSLETHDDTVKEDELNPFFIKHSTVNYTKLIKTTTIHDFIVALSGSVYYNLLSPFLFNTEHLNTFSVEMTLDMYYFRTIQKNIDKLLKLDSKQGIEYSMGSEIDMLNIIWIYRCKKYYEAPTEIIFSYIIPYKRRLQKDIVKDLVKAKDMNEFYKIVREKTPYGELVDNLNEKFIEENYDKLTYKISDSLGRRFPYSLAAMTAYNHMLEIESANIITLIEGVRYHLDKAELRTHLRF
jgi:Archaeal/vacuolar-type H+-ATPase subunit C